jgi:excisionase family DNA binding protein
MRDYVTIELPGQEAVLQAVTDVSERLSRIEAQVRSERVAYTYPEAANVTGLSVRFLQAEVAAGRLRAKRAGGRRIIGRTDLLDWYERLPDAAHAEVPRVVSDQSGSASKLRSLSRG